MAIQTLRDLAFKISMNVELNKLKQANQAVDDLKAKVLKMQRSVSKSMDIVNRRLNNIDTFRAVQRINKMTQATDKLKQAIGVATGATSPQTNNTGSKNEKSKKYKRESQFTLPHLDQWRSWNMKTGLLSQIALSGYYATLLKVNNIGLLINKNEATQAQLINKKDILTRKFSGSLSNIENIIGKSNYKMMGGLKGLGKLALISIKVAIALKMMRMSQDAYNQSLEVYKDMTDGLVRQEAFFANALKYRERIMGEALRTGANSYEEYRQVAQKSLMETRKNIEAVAQSGVIGVKSLTTMTGQLASFQIDTDAWFGGEQGLKHINALADLMASIQNKSGNKDESLRVANMIGKAVTLGHFGNLQRWGIVLSDAQKNMIKTGTTAQRLTAIMQGLEQNVGNFNKEMSKTPQGKLMKVNNEIGVQYYKLGQHMIFLKIQLRELYQSWLPIISIITRMGGAVLGLISKIVTVLTFLFTDVGKVNKKLESFMTVVKVIGTAILAYFFPVYALCTAILLVIEDFWVYLTDGESVIGYLIDWFKNLWKSIKDGYNNMIKYISDQWEKAKNKWFDMKRNFMDKFNELKEAFRNLFIQIRDIIKETLSGVFDWMGEKIENMKKIKDKMFSFFKDDNNVKNPILPQGDIPKNDESISSRVNNVLNIPSVVVNLDMSNTKSDITKVDIQEIIQNGFSQTFTDALIQAGVGE